jgi:membrane protease YdiL (CAAX protease family)
VFLDPPEATPARPDPHDVAEFSARIWRLSDLVIGIGLMLVSIVIVSLIAALVLDADAAPEDALFDEPALVLTLAFGLALGLIVAWLARRRGLDAADLGFVKPRSWWPATAVVFGAYAIIVLYGIVLAGLDALGADVSAFDEGNVEPFPEDATVTVYALAVLVIVVVAPVTEELFFRALAFRALLGSWGPAAGIAGSGLLFGLFHFDPNVIAPFTAIGALFAYSYQRTRSLWIPIAAHAIFNGASFAIGSAMGT